MIELFSITIQATEKEIDAIVALIVITIIFIMARGIMKIIMK